MYGGCVMRTGMLQSLLGLLLLLPASAGAASGMWAEASVSKDTPFAQQSVIYTIRIFSLDNLQSVELTPPVGPGVSVEELDRGTATSEMVRGRRYIVNQYRYVLTPMNSGVVEVGPARIVAKPVPSQGMGRYSPWGGAAPDRSVDLATSPVTLHVRPLEPGAQTPLEFLDIKATWGADKVSKPGEPLTLTLIQTARGVTGEHLQSLEPLLKTRDFKIYPERPQTDWKLVGDGSVLWGRRVETYTLVPTREGRLEFPELTVGWWDVIGQKLARSHVPAHTVLVGEAAMSGAAAAVEPSFMKRLLTQRAFWYYVVPVGGGLLLAFISGMWVGTGGQTGSRWLRRIGGVVAAVLGPLLGTLFAIVFRLLRAVMPSGISRYMAVARAGAARVGTSVLGAVVGLLPVRIRAWWCTRCVGSETDPVGFCQVLRRFACEHLNMPANSPLRSIAERIARDRPRADAAPLQRLFHELDRAVYSPAKLEVRRWRREFRRRFRRALASPTQPQLAARRPSLPELNP